MRTLVLNSVASALILGLSDLLTQSIQHYSSASKKPYNFHRWWTMILFGGFIRGPMLFLWFTKGLTRLFPRPGVGSVIKKTALDQLVFSPMFLCIYFVTMTLANGGNFQDAKRKVDQEFLPTQLKSWCLWPTVQLFNFWLVPPKHQIMSINVVAVGWMAYMSYVEFRNKMHIESYH